MPVRNTYYLSEFAGNAGGLANLTVDSAALVKLRSKLRNESIRLVIDKPLGGNAGWAINFDPVWGTNDGSTVIGGIVEFEWHLQHTTRQTVMDYTILRAAKEIIGNPNNSLASRGPALVAYGDTSSGAYAWTAPGALTDPANRAAWRFGNTPGKILTAGRIEDMLLVKQYDAATRPPTAETCGIAVYGDGLQENAGILRCISQGFKQTVCFPWPLTYVDGRNANIALRDNNFNGVNHGTMVTTGPTVAGSGVIALAGAGNVSGIALPELTLGMDVGSSYLGVELDDGSWHVGVVTAVSAGVSATIWPVIPASRSVLTGAVVWHNTVEVDVYGGSGTQIMRNTCVPGSTAVNRPVAPNYRLCGQHVTLSEGHCERSLAAVEVGGFVQNRTADFSQSSNITIREHSANATSGATTVTDMDFVRIPRRTATTDAMAMGTQPAHLIDGLTVVGITDKSAGSGFRRFINDEGDEVLGRVGSVVPRSQVGRTMKFPYTIGASNTTDYVYGPVVSVGERNRTRNVTLAAGTYDNYDRALANHLRVTTSGGTVVFTGFGECHEGDELTITNLGPDTVQFAANTGSHNGATFDEPGKRLWPYPVANTNLAVNQRARLVGERTPSGQLGWGVYVQ